MTSGRGHHGHQPSAESAGHDDDEIVELARPRFVSEAIAITQALKDAGIRATVLENVVPQILSEQGNRIMVFAHDLARAAQVLSDIEAQNFVEPESSASAVAKHVRHRGNTSG